MNNFELLLRFFNTLTDDEKKYLGGLCYENSKKLSAIAVAGMTLNDEEKKFVHDNCPIFAIKSVRERRRDLSLLDAKMVVDNYRDELYKYRVKGEDH